MRRILVLLSLPLLLSGCFSAIVAGGTTAGSAMAENRSIGRKVDDNVIYANLTHIFLEADESALLARVTFNIRFGRVMLTGMVPTEERAQRAVALSWKAKGVLEVINELIVTPDPTIFDTANDALIKRNLEARLLITKGVWVINYSLDVQNGIAYLIGRVKDKAEQTRVMNVARTTKGIKRIVSHLQINVEGNDMYKNDSRANSNEPADASIHSERVMPMPSEGNVQAVPVAPLVVESPDAITSNALAAPAKAAH